MAKVSVTINERRYQIACEDGQEAHLVRLASYVDNRIGELVASVGQVGDTQLLVMASLLIADELADAYNDLEGLRTSDRRSAERMDAEESLGAAMEALAGRIESIAEMLKRI